MIPFSEQNRSHGVLSGIDARVKIISALALLVMVLTHRGMLFPLFVFVSGMALCREMRIPAKILWIRFSEPLFVILVLLLLKIFFSGGVPFFSFQVLGVTVIGHWDGLLEGVRMACRILGAVTIVAVLGFSTPFNQFMAGLSWMKIPRGFVEVSMFAYRYIFMLLDDAMVIYNAQKNRLGYSTLRRGLSSFGILTGSLILKAFAHSQNTTVAMTQRGYDGVMPMLDHKPFRLVEVIGSACVIVIMGFVWKM
jgi:cobalt/nickel transport system permease protein